jgi:hypothetical protein
MDDMLLIAAINNLTEAVKGLTKAVDGLASSQVG